MVVEGFIMSAVAALATTTAPARSAISFDYLSLRIPVRALTMAGFRAWAHSPDYPERGRISLVGADLFIDMAPERLESHNAVKSEIVRVIGTIVRDEDLGVYLTSGLCVVNEPAGLAHHPDGSFISWASRESGRCRPVPSNDGDGDFIEMEGSFDWVTEIVSPASAALDTQRLREVYHRAGFSEYWLIDARGEEVQFEILLHEPEGYVAAPRRGNWQRSWVFGRLFHLQREKDRLGEAQFRLRTRKR
jgi:Uma2 family endonuclease